MSEDLDELLERMQVVILAGGRGTRLKEETELRPKPMLEVGGRPLLWHIMKIYEAWRVRRFVVCLGYRGDMIKRYFLEYDSMSSDLHVDLGTGVAQPLSSNNDERWEVILADTGPETGTGGRVKRVERYIDSDPFFCTYGDGLANVDLPQLLRFHMGAGRVATLTGVQPHGRFGHLATEGEIVHSFVEKPISTGGWVNGGFYVFDRTVFEHLDADSNLETGPMERLAATGQLGVYRHDAYWACVDTYRDYEELNAEWDSGRRGWFK